MSRRAEQTPDWTGPVPRARTPDQADTSACVCVQASESECVCECVLRQM